MRVEACCYSLMTCPPRTCCIPRPPELFLGFGSLSELSNSRLAMLGFVAAIASEFFTGA